MTKTYARVYLGFGSNLGDRRENIVEGLAMLNASGQLKVINASSLYETEPVGYTEQGSFLNAVAQIDTCLSPLDLLSLCKDIETRVGREPTVRWGPRILDIDILMYFFNLGGSSLTDSKNIYEEVIIETQDLTLPHPRIWERGFVIIPLAEINPDLLTPDGCRIQCLAQDFRIWKGVRLFEVGSWWKGKKSNPGGWQIIRFNKVKSTNTTAADLAVTGASQGACVVAKVQSEGRGKHGRVWYSPPGGLYLSILLKPKAQLQDMGWLSLAAGTAVRSAIREGTGFPATVKWPNDVLVSGKKVCGILSETRFIGNKLDYAIVGIGVNVVVDLNYLPDEVRETSTSLLSPDHPFRSEACESLTTSIIHRFSALYNRFLSKDFPKALQEIKECYDIPEQEVVMSYPGGPILMSGK